MTTKTILAKMPNKINNGKHFVTFKSDSFQEYNYQLSTISRKGGDVVKTWNDNVSDLEIEQYKFHLYEQGKHNR